MKLLITGANGFVGKNLRILLGERNEHEVLLFTREHTLAQLEAMVQEADYVFHLAGSNRPKDPAEFQEINLGLTQSLIDFAAKRQRPLPIAYTSSIQAELDNPYGASKRAAEEALLAYGRQTGSSVRLFRLPNVFGKWCRPNYNSAVATFCHNIAHDLPITINDPSAKVRLVYVDDVCKALIALLAEEAGLNGYVEVEPVYATTVGDMAEQIRGFKESRQTLITPRVGTGFTRALYSTYMSYLEPAQFAYTVPKYGDQRGVFVEMLKTPDAGQFSFFTALPGITRGGHYHHTKTEKFLVIKGSARFGFRHIVTDETFEILTNGDEPTIVETIPGWAHDITNIGEGDMVVMLWANEIFDRQNPDTIAHKV